jgi:putative flippase GtrA
MFQYITKLLTETQWRIGSEALPLDQLYKFCLVGIVNTILSYGLFIVFLNYFNYILSLIVLYVVVAAHSYLWNRFWTFAPTKNFLIELLKYLSVYSVVFILNALMLFILVNILSFDPRIGQLIALPIITIINFAGQKYWSFKA